MLQDLRNLQLLLGTEKPDSRQGEWRTLDYLLLSTFFESPPLFVGHSQFIFSE